MKFEVLFPHLDERQRRLLMGPRPGSWDMAGSGRSRELLGSVRQRCVRVWTSWRPARNRWGGCAGPAAVGRTPRCWHFVEPDVRGDPMSPLGWTTKSSSIRRWWQAVGRHDYPRAARLLITADAGDSNGYHTRAWKSELAAPAAQTDLDIRLSPAPRHIEVEQGGAERRLFSHISMNWRGRPLTSHEVIVNSIAATTTRTGLRVHTELDPGTYDAGVKVTDDEIDALPMTRHRFHGDWNYTLQPAGSPGRRPRGRTTRRRREQRRAARMPGRTQHLPAGWLRVAAGNGKYPA